MKKIAVITPVFNAEQYVLDCVHSVANSISNEQFAIEHILVDDCSTDTSWEIINQVGLPHLKPFQLNTRSGASAARNFGVRQTDADYLFCLDADDVIFQNSLRYLFDQIERDGIDWVYGDFLRTNETLEYLQGGDYYGNEFKSPSEALTGMLTGWHFFQQNCMYTKSLFDAVGGFDETLGAAQDFDLFVRFLIKGSLPTHVRSPLYLHRFHASNLSKSSGRENNADAHNADIKRFYLKYKDSLQEILTDDQLHAIERHITQ